MSTSSKLLVAAIDFGTTYSGYAFSFKHEYETDPLKVCSNNWAAGSRSLVSLKTPTCVLFDKDKVFDSFGYEAEDKYSELAEEEEHQEWYFFRRFKMSLFNKEKRLSEDVKIKSTDGKEMTADHVDMYREFETKKRAITGDTKGKVTIKIPISLVEMFEEDTDEDIKDSIENTKFSGKINWVGDKCRITAEIFKGLFEAASNNIVAHVTDLLKKHEISNTNNIIMVGGFSESPILQHIIKQAFPHMRVIIPPEAGLAVLKGAVLFGHKPATISSRVAKFTYGVATTMNFNPNIHPPEKKKKYGNQIKCIDIFSKHVEKGQQLKVNEAQSENTYNPVEDEQTSMCFQVYTSTELNPAYVTDEGCEKIGEMEVAMPDTSGGRNRSVMCEMIFGGTELEVKATIKRNGQVTKAKFNFLGSPGKSSS
uniref:Heat shock 70 kDa protein 12A n=1 Tax=Magallana gigas TaxID=29159 RepID=A0A8W8LC30_MAGGI